jgi:hypothetical protein
VCVLGLAVSLVLFGALLYLNLYEGVSLFSPPSLRKSSFTSALEQYDQTARENPTLGFRQHNGLLDALEKKAMDTENLLSVLKRRRNLAFHAPRDREQYLSSYISAAGRARKSFPHSSQIGALAAETLVLSESPAAGIAAELRELALLISRNYQDLSLCFSVYSGSMSDPTLAMSLPKELFPLLCSLAQGEEREKYLVNLCIRTLLDNNAQEATAMVNSLFENTPPLMEQTILFGAEFFYDHGNYLRSAELFSAFSDNQNMSRQGDALWLAGFIDSARGLWQATLSRNRTEEEVFGEDNASAVKARASYNLAATAPTINDAEHWLEELFSYGSEYEPGQIFGVIRYSRILPLDKAILVLEQTDFPKEGLFDLELVRRRSQNWTVDRTVAETWLLLNRHPADGRLYEWAVWYFDFQRRYEETALALRNTGINRVEGPWSALHRAYAMLRQDQLSDAEQTLRSIVRSPESTRAPGRFQQPLWQARADLGLLLEKKRNYEEALQCYEIAAGQLAGLFNYGEGRSAAKITPEQRDAARVQVYIARVFRTMGKTQESIRALDYALDLDPDNMEAKLEKRRFEAAPAVKLTS